VIFKLNDWETNACKEPACPIAGIRPKLNFPGIQRKHNSEFIQQYSMRPHEAQLSEMANRPTPMVFMTWRRAKGNLQISDFDWQLAHF